MSTADDSLTLELPPMSELRRRLEAAHSEADKLALLIRARRMMDRALAAKFGRLDEHQERCE